MADESLGLQIRDFFHDLFGSRLAMAAENELFRVRDDYDSRLADKDQTITDLRERVAALESKVDRYELVLIPLTSPAAGLFAPKKERKPFEAISDTKSSWDAYQEDYYRQQAEEEKAAADAAAKEKV